MQRSNAMNVQKMLVSIDYSGDSQQALQWAASLAGKYGAELILLHVIPKAVEEIYPRGARFVSPTSSFCDGIAVGDQPFGKQLIVVDLVDRAQTTLGDYAVQHLEAPVRMQVKIAVGKPAEEILRVAREERVDLILMGTHGRTGMRHLLLGSVAEEVSHHARAPVFTVRSTRKTAA
jgi:nucleotide-binding universal stress UspA family protein